MACTQIKQLVVDKQSVFHPDGVDAVGIGGAIVGIVDNKQYEPLAYCQSQSWLRRRYIRCLGVDKIEESMAYIVYFPSQWDAELQGLLSSVVSAMAQDAVIIVLEHTDDATGKKLCGWGDFLQKHTSMQCVMDQHQYIGELPWLQGQYVMVAQLWKGGTSRHIAVDQWVKY